MILSKLDAWTLSVMEVVIHVIFLVIFIVASRTYKQRYISYFITGIALQIFGYILLGMTESPIWLSSYLANVCIIYGIVGIGVGLHELVGYTVPWRAILICLMTHLLTFHYFTFIENNLRIRLLLFSAEIAIVTFYLGMTMYGYYKHKGYSIVVLLIFSYIANTSIFVIGFLVEINNPHLVNLFEDVYILKYLFLSGIIVNIIGYTATILLITKQLEERLKVVNHYLEELATIDYLTKTKNLRSLITYLDDEIEKVVRYKRPSSIVMIDLDRFKRVNDVYGHVVGDEVLVTFSEVVKKEIRNIDVFGRYGGEEFLLILPETNLINALHTVKRIQDIMRNYQWKYEGLVTTFSAGILEINKENCHKETRNLIDAADKLLYKAKNNGRDRIEYDEQLLSIKP